jgi:type III secretion protein H
MKIERSEFTDLPYSFAPPLQVNTDDVNKMSQLMSDKASNRNAISSAKKSESDEFPETNAPVIKEWYETFKKGGDFSEVALKRSFESTLASPGEQKEAMWYAFEQEKNVKGTNQGTPELLSLLEQNLLGNFSDYLKAAAPKDRQELKALLSEHFSLSKQKEQALFHSWGELKDVLEHVPLMDIVKKELGSLIQTNAMLKNIITHSHKLDLE